MFHQKAFGDSLKKKDFLSNLTLSLKQKRKLMVILGRTHSQSSFIRVVKFVVMFRKRQKQFWKIVLHLKCFSAWKSFYEHPNCQTISTLSAGMQLEVTKARLFIVRTTEQISLEKKETTWGNLFSDTFRNCKLLKSLLGVQYCIRMYQFCTKRWLSSFNAVDIYRT